MDKMGVTAKLRVQASSPTIVFTRREPWLNPAVKIANRHSLADLSPTLLNAVFIPLVCRVRGTRRRRIH
ncbi:hypothetical protein D9M72_321440 [compost metagenome]